MVIEWSCQYFIIKYYLLKGFPGGSVGKEYTCNAGDSGSIPGSGRSPGKEHGNPLQYSCLENPKDRGYWQAIVHRVPKSQTQLKRLSMHSCTIKCCLALMNQEVGFCFPLSFTIVFLSKRRVPFLKWSAPSFPWSHITRQSFPGKETADSTTYHQANVWLLFVTFCLALISFPYVLPENTRVNLCAVDMCCPESPSPFC